MARRCAITGKGAMSGNNVSHSNRKTRRLFLPNIQSVSLYSESLDRAVPVKLSVKGLRTIEHKGGLDAFVLNTAPSKLEPSLRKLRKQIEKAQAGRSAA